MPESSIPSALVVVDMLRDFFDPDLWPHSELPGLKADLVEQVNRCVGRFRRAGCPVIWIRQAFQADLEDAFPHMRQSGRAYTIEGTQGVEFLSGLDRENSDLVILKKRFSAFFGTTLKDNLDRLGIRRVFLSGITTSWCIRSTATDAYQHDFEVFLCRDALAGFSHGDHERDLEAMNGYIAQVVNFSELTERLSSSQTQNTHLS